MICGALRHGGAKRSLPNNKKGSRIVITTRLTDLASKLSNSNSLGMKLLDDDGSWDLLSKTVFGKKDSPLELEKIGKKIGKNCRGLPLSIVVVGGLLAKSEQTIEYWEHMENNLNAIVNLEDDERCLKTLYMSYKQLPVHLKPCFLYMRIYREDLEISVTYLIKLWVAEGFLKPVSGKRLEDVARECLKDLIDRNLILIHKLDSIGSIKYCKVHDLLRDLCLREAQKEGFYIICPRHVISNVASRIVMSGSIHEIEEIDVLLFASLPRSLIFDLDDENQESLPPHILKRMRRVGSLIKSNKFIENEHQLVNSRALAFSAIGTDFPSLICQFWNLQTLNIGSDSIAPTYIWYLSHIRHLYGEYLYFPDPPNAEDGIVLANLQTLRILRDFTCSEQMVKRIPNIRELDLDIYYYNEVDDNEVDERLCLSNLDCLDKLESFNFIFSQVMCQINYPESLKKLSLSLSRQQRWQDILDKIGGLPLLEKLKLIRGTFNGEWETTEGQFRRLKSLSLKYCKDLQVWTSEASHFPRLEQLRLYRMNDFEEIPLDFAEIPTLRVTDMDNCSDSAVESAKRILEEQEALYGEEETTLQIQVKLSGNNNEALTSFRSPNFHVKLFNE